MANISIVTTTSHDRGVEQQGHEKCKDDKSQKGKTKHDGSRNHLYRDVLFADSEDTRRVAYAPKTSPETEDG